MNKITLDVVALTNSESHPGNYALILEEQNGKRRFPVVIGSFEAQAIAVTLENMNPQRPLTHDLFKQTLDRLQASLREVVIYQLVENVFYAHMVVQDGRKEAFTIEARSSDAIALAVRFDCPIYTYEAVLAEAGFTDEPGEADLKKGPFSDYPVEKLEELLAKVLAKEDYKSAARIRDVLDKKRRL